MVDKKTRIAATGKLCGGSAVRPSLLRIPASEPKLLPFKNASRTKYE
jgi:hypothetical protein